jgi:hypothetical protein
MKNTALTGKPKSLHREIWQSRVVEEEIPKATYRLIGSLMHGNTKELDSRENLNLHLTQMQCILSFRMKG